MYIAKIPRFCSRSKKSTETSSFDTRQDTFIYAKNTGASVDVKDSPKRLVSWAVALSWVTKVDKMPPIRVLYTPRLVIVCSIRHACIIRDDWRLGAPSGLYTSYRGGIESSPTAVVQHAGPLGPRKCRWCCSRQGWSFGGSITWERCSLVLWVGKSWRSV